MAEEKKYSIPVYENGIKTKYTVDFVEGDKTWKTLMQYNSEIPAKINVNVETDD